ncbi:helix-turn-helix domain-containing protein [Pedobacter nanyangensis]|uniref:helix-turn-helix domain-containing protein n=1 Tax=Pedobacter nanyangensis TaxID=1562389 RepID=UPI000DE1D3F1|nr:helix-turn-helix domain-containing protein [Pedobacter nanyangensis]
MDALPSLRIKRKVKLPLPKKYPIKPTTIGDHLKKRRLNLKLKQTDVAKILGVHQETISIWEDNKNKPQIFHYPAIHNFLGYTTVSFDESTFSGRVSALRWKNGLSFKQLGSLLGADPSTVSSWANGECIPPKLRMICIDKIIESLLSQKT